MTRKELNKSLKELREEVNKLDFDSSDTKQKIDLLASSIEDELDNLDNTKYIDTLVKNIQEHIERYESEHPRVTGILNRIMVTLSGLGI